MCDYVDSSIMDASAYEAYNAISPTYGLPYGGDDIDTFVGDVRLTAARGDEAFVTLGTDENALPTYALDRANTSRAIQ